MQIYSHYIWESGSEEKKNPVSLVLQQVSLKNHHYLLACVCDGRKSFEKKSVGRKMENGEISDRDVSSACGSLVSGYFTERLVEWFHHHYLEILQKSRGEDAVLKALSVEVGKIEKELQDYGRQKDVKVSYDVRGIFLYDSQCWIFGQGECQGYRFNRRFNRRQRRKLPGGEGQHMEIVQGKVQRDIGIMLCNAGFGELLTEEEMVQVMFGEHLTDRDINKRLRELWKEDVGRGNRDTAGAIYIEVE